MTEVRLFSTCLAEEFRPSVIESSIKVLERLKLKVRPVRSSFCCGQAPFNEGLREPAFDLARRFLKACEPGMPIIIPSGSCTAMAKIFYSDLFADDPTLAAKAAALRPWLFELSQFIVNVMKVKFLGARYDHVAAYHPSCHLSRELRVIDEPRLLLASVEGLKMVDFRNPEECCGFGGLFSVKFPHISVAMAEDKIARLKESGAEVLISADCGCLMQLGGVMHRQGVNIATAHLAEVLASR
jgi:L-lactate dehydrogenase complex protein LldE